MYCIQTRRLPTRFGHRATQFLLRFLLSVRFQQKERRNRESLADPKFSSTWSLLCTLRVSHQLMFFRQSLLQSFHHIAHVRFYRCRRMPMIFVDLRWGRQKQVRGVRVKCVIRGRIGCSADLIALMRGCPGRRLRGGIPVCFRIAMPGYASVFVPWGKHAPGFSGPSAHPGVDRCPAFWYNFTQSYGAGLARSFPEAMNSAVCPAHRACFRAGIVPGGRALPGGRWARRLLSARSAKRKTTEI